MIRRGLLTALLADLLGAGIASVVHRPHAAAGNEDLTAGRTLLSRHIGSPADLGGIRGGAVTWDASDAGTLGFNVNGNDVYAWATIPQAAGAVRCRPHRQSRKGRTAGGEGLPYH